MWSRKNSERIHIKGIVVQKMSQKQSERTMHSVEKLPLNNTNLDRSNFAMHNYLFIFALRFN